MREWGWEHGDGSIGMGAWGKSVGTRACGSVWMGAWGTKNNFCLRIYAQNCVIQMITFFTVAWKYGRGE